MYIREKIYIYIARNAVLSKWSSKKFGVVPCIRGLFLKESKDWQISFCNFMEGLKNKVLLYTVWIMWKGLQELTWFSELIQIERTGASSASLMKNHWEILQLLFLLPVFLQCTLNPDYHNFTIKKSLWNQYSQEVLKGVIENV